MIRAVLDSNVLISALIGTRTRAAPYRVLEAAAYERYEFVLSGPILIEVARAFRSRRLAPYLERGAAREYLLLIRRLSSIALVAGLRVSVATHPEDDWVLATAVSGEADYLVTGDRQLQAMDSRHGLGHFQIVGPAAFLAILAAG